MKFSCFRLALVVAGCASLSAHQAGAAAVSSKPLTDPHDRLPLGFEPNLGQTSKQVQWLARGPSYTLFLAGNDAVLEMNATTPPGRPGEPPTIRSSALRMNLVRATKAEPANGERPLAGKANYFTGKDATKWQRDVPTYGQVRLHDVYPGIDLLYHGRQGRLEYDFVVAAGADPSVIRLRFDGAKPALAANGDLKLPVADKEVRFDRPVAYQVKDGVRQPVDSRFTIAMNQQVSFKLGAYDVRRELIIDPTLIFLGALGTGDQQSVPNGMAVNAAGEIILTGITNDLTFPTTTGALQTSCQTYSTAAAAAHYVRCGASSASSAFVTKISADGTSLVYSTYLHGGGGAEYGESVAVDAAGDAYLLGATSSSDFPITTDAYETLCQPYYPMVGVSNPPNFGARTAECDNMANGGGTEYTVNGPVLFVAKLNPGGSALLYSTFFGGSMAVLPVALALDSANNIYFSGYVQNALAASGIYPNTSNIQFPVTAGAYQSVGTGLEAATLSKLSADGHTLLYSTLLGVTDPTFFATTQPFALAVGPNGMAYLGGMTLASKFPTTFGAIRTSCVTSATAADCVKNTGFLSAFDTTKMGDASLVYSTFIGGTEVAGSNSPMQQVLGLAADSANNVYVTGNTAAIDFPTTPGAYQTTCGHANPGNQCAAAFLSKVNPTGSAFVWSTYLGGTSASPVSTQGNAVALDAQGRVYLYGLSQDGGGDFPVVNPLQAYFGGSKVFVAAFSADASQLMFATRFGNTSAAAVSSEQPIANNGIAVDPSGNIYFAGYTSGGGGFVTTAGAYSTTATGGFNRGFFAKVSPMDATPSPDAGASDAASDAASLDAAEMDAANPDATSVDATVDLGGADAGVRKSSSGGCGCSMSDRERSPAAGAFLSLAVLAMVRRRRRAQTLRGRGMS
ncbi:MAG TPA: SBBP repeat-containing protein [Polyangia bacterium]|jgi:MYXO-CTERM domain-containing protein